MPKRVLKNLGVVGSLLGGSSAHGVGGLLGTLLETTKKKKKKLTKNIDAFHTGYMDGVNDNDH